ncbi:MAG: alanine racemase [Calditerrivibrio sp.]|nr:alanine racemase [Calditerrivibrio sp.]
MKNIRGTYALIHLDRYLNNLSIAKRLSNSEITPVIKADGYGHGAVPLARFTMANSNIDTFCVATIEEGITLRKGLGNDANIIILGYVDEAYFDEVVKNNFLINIYDDRVAGLFNKYLRYKGITYPVSLKIDTGMNRLGYNCDFDIRRFMESFKNLSPRLIMSHLSSPDSDIEYTNYQVKRFDKVVQRVKSAVPNIKSSLFNSPALVYLKNSFDYSRPGIISYGFVKSEIDLGLRPVMAIYSKFIHIKYLEKGESIGYNRTYVTTRKTVMGVLPIGYADGYKRSLSNKGYVYVKGYRCQVIGRVCMDMIMVDITDLPEQLWDEEVEILGDNVRADDLASLAGTISYEIFTSISPRIPRIYKED